MNILISNDDGYDAPGLQTLLARLEQDGHRLLVAAPATQQSAKSHSLSLYNPVNCRKVDEDRYKIWGTPADCVLIAEKLLFKNEQIDLVISGINRGQNIGEDIYYSGTVAAAREGSFHGYKALAVSQIGFDATDFSLAAEFVAQALQAGVADYIVEKEFLNINVPKVDRAHLKGVRVTKLGHREFVGFSKGQFVDQETIVFNLGEEDIVYQKTPGTDIAAVYQDNEISVTPVFANLASKMSIKKLESWNFLKEFK